MQVCSAEGGATLDGNRLIRWKGDWVLKLIVPFDLSGPDTDIGQCDLSLKSKDHINSVYNVNYFALTIGIDTLNIYRQRPSYSHFRQELKLHLRFI